MLSEGKGAQHRDICDRQRGGRWECRTALKNEDATTWMLWLEKLVGDERGDIRWVPCQLPFVGDRRQKLCREHYRPHERCGRHPRHVPLPSSCSLSMCAQASDD